MPEPLVKQIHVRPDGSVDFTRDPLLTPIFDGRGQMQRITEIEKLEYSGKYYFTWLKGPYAGTIFDTDQAKELGIADVRIDISDGANWRCVFPTYEEAVSVEVQAVEALRQRGHTFKE